MMANNICAYCDLSLAGKMDLRGSVFDSSAYVNATPVVNVNVTTATETPSQTPAGE